MKLHRLIWLIAALLLIYPASLSADKEPKVLLINSDARVEKYRVAQEEFTKALSRHVHAINLNDTQWKAADVESRNELPARRWSTLLAPRRPRRDARKSSPTGLDSMRKLADHLSYREVAFRIVE